MNNVHDESFYYAYCLPTGFSHFIKPIYSMDIPLVVHIEYKSFPLSLDVEIVIHMPIKQFVHQLHFGVDHIFDRHIMDDQLSIIARVFDEIFLYATERTLS